MTVIPIFKGFTEKGKLRIVNVSDFNNYIAKFKDGKPLEVIVRRKMSKRSDPQNKYYWGVVLAIISEHTGHTAEELHEAFKQKFLKKFINKGLVFARSTTALNKIEFADYLDKVIQWAAEWEIVIPDSNGVVVP